jgi:CSLREA domain-containing protein
MMSVRWSEALPRRLALAILLATLAMLAAASSASAATINVNTKVDELNTDGDCALREAVMAANGDAAVDACPAGGP